MQMQTDQYRSGVFRRGYSECQLFSLKMILIPAFGIKLSCWIWIGPAFENIVDPDQLASEEAKWSWCELLVIQSVNLYQDSGLSNLIGW